MLQNARVTAFTVSELLRENQHGRGERGEGKITAPKIWFNVGKLFGALLTDLCKAFDCFSHNFLYTKLDAYGFSLSTLKLTRSYLKNRKQKTEIDATCSS